MSYWKPAFLILLTGICTSHSYSQSFGGNPNSIKWRQVNTPAAKIIYPKGLDSLANRIATVTELVGKEGIGNIGREQRKISVVLQANNTISNAYVGLGPYRSEFYLTVPQNPFELGSQRWIDNLSIHEFRHVSQYSNFNHGLAKVFSILLGQQGQAFANALSIPDWFFEGDAVWNETAFSRQGRGRLPQSFSGYKSLYNSDRHYSYLKLRNGSYRDYVPDHYDLGYLLVSYGREKYGDSIWHKITADAARFKGLFYPLQKSVKRHTGINYTAFANDALKYFQQQWQEERKTESNVQWITAAEKHNVISYKYPYPAINNSLVLLKRSYRQVPAFIQIDSSGLEKKIAVKDIAYDDYFSYKNGRIIYTTLRPDARWGNRDYSDIRLLDIVSKKARTISVKAKYYSPDITNDGKQIVVVNADPAGTCMLHLLSSTGEIRKAWTADSSLFYAYPKFLDDDRRVVLTARQPNGHMGWMIWNTVTDEHDWLLQPVNQMLGFPVVIGDTLFYSATAGNSDGLFAIDLNAVSQPVCIANYSTGIYQGFERNGSITATAFTADGYRLGNFERLRTTDVQQKLDALYVTTTLNNKPDLTEVPTKSFQSGKYNKAFRLFNFHSWQPEISESEYTVALLGENVLNTLLSKIYYTYNHNESSNKLGISEIFGGWFVQPYINASQTWGRDVQLNVDTTLTYNEGVAGIGLRLPLNLSFNKAYRYLTLSASFNHDQVNWTGFAKDRYQNTGFDYIAARLNYSVQIQKAVQHIYPRYAETFVAAYDRSVSKYKAWQYLLNGSLYLPGIGVNHNLVVNAAYQLRDTMQQYIFSNSFPFSRGYNDVNFPKMFRIGVNYHIPLLYPDWGFGNIVYFQRIRGNAFYDYTWGTSIRQNKTYPFSTAGAEIYFDTKWWNQQPITFGVRYSRLLNNEYRGNTQPNQWEIILPVDLLPR